MESPGKQRKSADELFSSISKMIVPEFILKNLQKFIVIKLRLGFAVDR